MRFAVVIYVSSDFGSLVLVFGCGYLQWFWVVLVCMYGLIVVWVVFVCFVENEVLLVVLVVVVFSCSVSVVTCCVGALY